jgi:hypothetical protein
MLMSCDFGCHIVVHQDKCMLEFSQYGTKGTVDINVVSTNKGTEDTDIEFLARVSMLEFEWSVPREQ